MQTEPGSSAWSTTASDSGATGSDPSTLGAALVATAASPSDEVSQQPLSTAQQHESWSSTAAALPSSARQPPRHFPTSMVGRVEEYFTGYEYPDPANNETSSSHRGREQGLVTDPGRLSVVAAVESEEDEGEGSAETRLDEGTVAGAVAGAIVDDDKDAIGLPLDLPDDSLADADLHDHDRIDSVTYIYFGSGGGGGGGAGRSNAGAASRGAGGRRALAAGAALALVAQLLALASAARRLARSKGGDAAAAVLAHTAIALAAASGAWLMGAPIPPAPSHAVVALRGQGEAWQGRCVAQALLLHWLHAAAACWLLLASLLVLRRLRDAPPPRARRWAPLAWGIPAILVAACYAADAHGYETRRFCWTSVQRGMLLSFLLPIGVLIAGNTWLAMASLRLLARLESPEKPSGAPPSPSRLPLLLALPSDPLVAQRRRAVRAAAALLPLFAVHWFLAVLALENPSSLVLAGADAVLNSVLNWFLVWNVSSVWASTSRRCTEPPLASPQRAGVPPPPPSPMLIAAAVAAAASARAPPDAQPLLEPDPPCSWLGATPADMGGELLELQLDALSTISS